jgi:protein-L-isoaspartate(D-aspartate) O-methyltransferase
MVEQLATQMVVGENVLEALRRVPRHLFMESVLSDAAYEDKALPIAEGQTISQPTTVALQTHLLAIKPRQKVLEIGTGSGYQAAILCEMGAKVYTVEIHRSLYFAAQQQLQELGYEPQMLLGDGSMGWAANAPFDRILVTAASPTIPQPLKQQLAIGGRLVIPVGTRTRQQMCVVIRTDIRQFEIQRMDACAFVPLLGANGFGLS